MYKQDCNPGQVDPFKLGSRAYRPRHKAVLLMLFLYRTFFCVCVRLCTWHFLPLVLNSSVFGSVVPPRWPNYSTKKLEFIMKQEQIAFINNVPNDAKKKYRALINNNKRFRIHFDLRPASTVASCFCCMLSSTSQQPQITL